MLRPCDDRRGYTLLELSIVLVIIALLVGGITIGKDLIKGSQLRGTVSQIGEYNSAANTFREKYKYYPGDMLSSEVSRYGFFTETTLGATDGHQDGDGLIEGGGAGSKQNAMGEITGFWRHLTDAQMIDGNYCTTASGNPIVATTGLLTTTATAGLIHQVFPPTKFGNGSYIFPFRSALTNENHFQIAALTSLSAVDGSMGVPAAGGGITPLDGKNMDIKMDDGLAENGNVQVGYLDGGYIYGTGCVVSSNTYDTGTTFANQTLCTLRIKFQ